MTLLEPKILKKNIGTWFLNENPKFWVLFTFYNKNKIENDIDSKEKVRRQIVDIFFEYIEDEFSENQKLLKKYLDNILYLPEAGKIFSCSLKIKK
jgi:hypothetical protein